MATKAAVAAWLKERGWVFTEMSEAQKWEMRQALNICGYATSSSSRRDPCPKAPAENGRCKTPGHGGAAKKGLAHPNFKHGAYSRFQPRPWIATYQKSMDDPGLESLRRDLATSEAVIVEILQRIDAGGGTIEQQAELVGTVRSFLGAVAQRDAQAMSRLGPRVELLVEQDFLEEDLRAELKDWLGLRRELAEAESRRVKRLQDTETAESAARRVNSLAVAVKKNTRRMVEQKWLSKDQADEFLEWVVEDIIPVTGPPARRGLEADEE